MLKQILAFNGNANDHKRNLTDHSVIGDFAWSYRSTSSRHTGEGQYLLGSQCNSTGPSLRWDDGSFFLPPFCREDSGFSRHTGVGQYLFNLQRNSIGPSLRWDDVHTLFEKPYSLYYP